MSQKTILATAAGAIALIIILLLSATVFFLVNRDNQSAKDTVNDTNSTSTPIEEDESVVQTSGQLQSVGTKNIGESCTSNTECGRSLFCFPGATQQCDFWDCFSDNDCKQTPGLYCDRDARGFNSPLGGFCESVSYRDLPSPQLKDVSRFLNRKLLIHFYTIDDSEKNIVRNNLQQDWKYENDVFKAFTSDFGNSNPVYRFLNKQKKIHFYTMDESEKNEVIKNLSNEWQYESIAYHAFNRIDDYPDLKPLHRFVSIKQAVHFYTADEGERDIVQNNLKNDWRYEGIAYYVIAP